MFFSRLTARNFRNFSEVTLALNPGVNLFVGNNGQGKTNLIEAVHFLANGESFRPGKNEVWLRQISGGQVTGAQIVGEADRDGLRSEVQVRFQTGKREYFVDQKRVATAVLAEKFPTVLFSPESLSAIKEGPEQRRQLIDEVLIASGQAKRVYEFRRALRSRNRLLRDFHDGLYSKTQVTQLLEAFDQVYLPIAATVAFERIRHIHALEPFLRDALNFIAPRDFVDISVDYEISSQSARQFDLADVLDSLRNRLKSLRKSEIASGISLVGPHKHEVHFLSAGNDARYFCSQGQQRALILGFKIAQIMYHYKVFQVHPLLLLDDVLSELDPSKGANLLKFLESVRSQILLTTTDIAFPFDFGSKAMSVYRLNHGSVETLTL